MFSLKIKELILSKVQFSFGRLHFKTALCFKLILQRSGCKDIRFHDLRHTFATMTIENGMDVKTLSGIIGHISAETTLNIYSHITDTMRVQASVKIDRKIGGTNAEMPEPKNGRPKRYRAKWRLFEPYKPKIRKSGTGCIYQVNENLWGGSFYPRLPGGKHKKFNVYAKTREKREKKLAKMIAEKKAEIAKLKQSQKKGWQKVIPFTLNDWNIYITIKCVSKCLTDNVGFGKIVLQRLHNLRYMYFV